MKMASKIWSGLTRSMTIALNTPNNANRRYERMRRYDTIHIFGAAVTPYYYYYLYNIYDEDMNIYEVREFKNQKK